MTLRDKNQKQDDRKVASHLAIFFFEGIKINVFSVTLCSRHRAQLHEFTNNKYTETKRKKVKIILVKTIIWLDISQERDDKLKLRKSKSQLFSECQKLMIENKTKEKTLTRNSKKIKHQ